MGTKKETNRGPGRQAGRTESRLRSAGAKHRAAGKPGAGAHAAPAHGRKREHAFSNAPSTYRVIVQAMGEGAVTLSRDGTILYCNRRFGGIVGVRASKVIGTSIYGYAPLEEKPTLEALIAEGGSRGAHAEVTIKGRRGRQAHCYVASSSLDKALPGAVFLVITDITQRKENEQALQRSSELLENMFANIHLLVAYMDADCNFIRVNRAYAEAGGHPEAFYIGKNHFALYPHKENEAIFRKVVRTGEPYSVYEKPFEYAEYPERGVTYWDWSLQAVNDAGGKVEGLVLSLRDATGEVRGREALNASETRYGTLLAQAVEMIVVFDDTGRILDANQSTAAFTGYPKEQLVGMKVPEFMDPVDLALRPFGTERLREGATVVVERRWVRRDGTVRHLDGNSRMISPGVYMAIMRDVTDRKIAEEKILAYQEQLRTVALELTLAEERTRRQIAKDLHDQVGQALAFCQIKLGHLREAARSGLHVRSIDDVRESISGVIKHTRQLTFELGSPILYELGLEAALERLVEKMGEQYGIALQFADDGQPKPLDDDTRSAFYIVIKELLTNVVKHAHAQKARVWLRRDGETAVASVTDDGAGMEPSKAGQGFTEGGGYGLFSARERMNYLGGTLEINSQPGGGSTITVTAPLKRKKRRKG